MTNKSYELIGNDFKDTADVPKGKDIFYRCLKCETMIPSIPPDSIGCNCGEIFIDKDYWRLAISSMKNLEVIRRKVKKNTKSA